MIYFMMVMVPAVFVIYGMTKYVTDEKTGETVLFGGRPRPATDKSGKPVLVDGKPKYVTDKAAIRFLSAVIPSTTGRPRSSSPWPWRSA